MDLQPEFVIPRHMQSRPMTYRCCYRGLFGYVDVEADVTPTPLFHATCHHDPGHTSTGAALEVCLGMFMLRLT